MLVPLFYFSSPQTFPPIWKKLSEHFCMIQTNYLWYSMLIFSTDVCQYKCISSIWVIICATLWLQQLGCWLPCFYWTLFFWRCPFHIGPVWTIRSEIEELCININQPMIVDAFECQVLTFWKKKLFYVVLQVIYIYRHAFCDHCISIFVRIACNFLK